MMLIPPDPNNTWEMDLWTTIAVMSAVSRVTPEGFVLLILAGLGLVGYFLLLAIWEGVLRLFSIYHRYAFSNTRDARILQISGIVFVVLLLIASALHGNERTASWSLIVVSNGLFVFVVIAELIAWRASRQNATSTLPQQISLQNVVAWQNQVKQANKQSTP